MKLAIITCGILPIPAVLGGAVENLVDFYLEYNNQKKIHDITVYSPWSPKITGHPALSSDVNHFIFIDVTSLYVRIMRRIRSYFHRQEYYNYFIEYYFEKVYNNLKKGDFDYIILENSPGHAYKLSQRGYHNLVLHLNNNLLNSETRYHNEIYNSLALILPCSNYIKEKVCSIHPSNKIRTLYNAIDTKKFIQGGSLNVSRKDLGFSSEDFILVYSGRINKDKGISEIIDAMLLLKDNYNMKLLIIGGAFYGNASNEDDFVNSLKAKASDIKEKITFTGFIPYEKVPSYLQLADIAVLPSIWDEPFGLTIVEAMASGLPLITTRSGGIPEICEGVATIVDRENIVERLTDAILDLYHHPDKRKQMASAALERAKLFDKETYAKNFFTALEDLKGNT